MLSNASEKVLARVLAVGAGFTTIFLVSDSVTDPVNVTKLLSLGVTAFIVLGIMIACGLKSLIESSLKLWIISALFLFFGLSSILFSKSPFSQGFYGSYGRNNGLLAYIFLVIVLLAAASLKNLGSLNKVIVALLIAGITNVIYSLWVILFGDFIGWSNPYGNILGTLGNPNFIGAFLGIFIAAYLAVGVSKRAPRWFRFSLMVTLPVTAFEIYDSSAIQGRVVGIFGIAIVGFFIIRSKFKPMFAWAYLVLSGILGTVAVLGALQIGPLTQYIYKRSVSLRGQYWLAGWNTGEHIHLLELEWMVLEIGIDAHVKPKRLSYLA